MDESHMIGFASSLSYRNASIGNAVRQLINRLDTLKVGPPLFSVIWWPLRTSIPNEYIAADGQELLQLDYQDAYKGILAGLVPVCLETEW